MIDWNKHIMLYNHGETSARELILVPVRTCNWGPLINHRNDGNCGSVRLIIDKKIHVLIYSKIDITAGS